MNDIKELFQDIKSELTMIRKENREFALNINTLTIKLNENTTDIDKLKIEFDNLRKEKASLNFKLIECSTKIENLEKEVGENEEFKASFRKNLWKALWWILGLVSAGFAGVVTYFTK